MPVMGSGGYDRAMGLLLGVTTTVHRILHTVSGGRWARRFPGGAVVVWLTVPGRRSGEPRTTPLLAARESAADDAAWVVAGSNGGQSKVPAWVFNARAATTGWLEVDGQRFEVAVTEVTDPGERERCYSLLVGVWRWFDGYARRTAGVREIPVFRLTPGQGSLPAPA